MSLAGTVRREEVLWALGSLCGLYRLPFDSGLVAQQFPPPYSVGTFHEAARSLGCNAVMLGVSQRSAIYHMLRGNVLRGLTRWLPESYKIITVG